MDYDSGQGSASAAASDAWREAKRVEGLLRGLVKMLEAKDILPRIAAAGGEVSDQDVTDFVNWRYRCKAEDKARRQREAYAKSPAGLAETEAARKRAEEALARSGGVFSGLLSYPYERR